MLQTYALSDKEDGERRPFDRVYLVVFGLVFAVGLGALGGTMAYFVWAREEKDGTDSLAEYYSIPTPLISLVLIGAAGLLLLIALGALLSLRCQCGDSSPEFARRGTLCPEAGSTSTQILALSRETLQS